jgi:hypothetical protein
LFPLCSPKSGKQRGPTPEAAHEQRAIFKLIKFRNFEVKNLILPDLVGAAGSEDHESKLIGSNAKVTHVSFQSG